MELMTKIRELGEIYGIDYIGAAGIGNHQREIAEIGGVLPAGWPRALSIGIALPDSIVDRLNGRETYEDIFTYEELSYRVINDRLDMFASVAASHIQKAGWRVLPLPAAERIDSDRVCASLSHKITARLCGFGWIGKNCLLITPEHGPRVRWTTVLTDAPFEENKVVMDTRCGGCTACAEACPAGAITGRNYASGEPREARLDVHQCEAYLRGRKETLGLAVCGRCLAVCPWGRKNPSRSGII